LARLIERLLEKFLVNKSKEEQQYFQKKPVMRNHGLVDVKQFAGVLHRKDFEVLTLSSLENWERSLLLNRQL
jgi:hypothetical protein